MAGILRVANVQGFWGDSPGAAATMMQQAPDVDFLTMDYLAEVSLSIMAIQQDKDPSKGYAADFVQVIESLIPFWQDGSRVKIVSNAGGLNPKSCAEACAEVLQQSGCKKKIAIVGGDNVLGQMRHNPTEGIYSNLESDQPLTEVFEDLVTANAYLGADGVTKALIDGADIVITGRVADPSMVVGAAVYHHRWSWKDYQKIAGATVAGHLIECGTQVTGGISTNWLDIPHPGSIGFPIVEIENEGACTVTKPANTGGRVDLYTVKEQLVYEIGDPNNYLSPDATVSFNNLQVKQTGPDRVRVWGAQGGPPSNTYKVSATYRDGFRAEAMLVVVGKNAPEKARRGGETVKSKLENAGLGPEKFLIEVLGTGDSVGGTVPSAPHLYECVLRMACYDHDRDKVARFTQEIAPLVTSGPAGTTGYASGRPKVRPVFGYWPCLARRTQLQSTVEMLQTS